MNKQPILAFGAHPDDIEIGMGGTIKKLSSVGRKVVVCIATVPNEIAIRKKEVAHSTKVLGVSKVIFLDIPFKKFGFNRETIGKIDKLLKNTKPSSVFTHSVADSHQDHLNLTNCVLSAGRRNDFSIFMYEQIIPSGITHIPFRPQHLVDISDHIDDKIKSVQAHKSQLKKYGNDWTESIRGRATNRGHQIQTKFAEAFEVIKIKESRDLLLHL